MLDSHQTAPTIKGMYIDGAWTPAARTFEDLNPSDNTTWARIPDCTAEDVNRAVAAARARTTPPGRASPTAPPRT